MEVELFFIYPDKRASYSTLNKDVVINELEAGSRVCRCGLHCENITSAKVEVNPKKTIKFE